MKYKYGLLFLLLMTGCFFFFNSNNEDYSFKIVKKQINFNNYTFDLFKLNNSSVVPTNRLLDLKEFRYLISNNPCKQLYISKHNISTIQIITSYAGNVEARRAIRRAYPRYELEKLGIVRLFLLALCKPNGRDRITQHALFHENSRYGDLIQGNFLEDYKNLTYKHVMGLKWATTKCYNLKYIIKMDDDILVDLYDLNNIITKKHLKETELAGYLLKDLRPIRMKANKWYVTSEEYSDNTYPSFLSGWMYVVSVQLALKLVNSAHMVPYFWIDDLFITGILANQLNAKFIDLSEYFSLHPEVVECCIRLRMKCGFFVAPTSGDYALQTKFHDHCYTCRTFMNACRTLPRGKTVEKMCVAKRRMPTLGKGLPHFSIVKI
ncbi:beta-1,3-galactosyltransferase 5 [Rhodnius prolixus]|uniref:beta-1,3-galactosyltransferase 5 n=1 Tax=Rhodnius prolixus TaxID=13249 RepID=UPI003D18F7DF